MPENVDEELIEATIRRVQKAQAEREHGPDAPAETPADEAAPLAVEPAPNGHAPAPEAAAGAPDEELIEATIRRVQQAQAEREHEPEPDVAPDPLPAPEDPPRNGAREHEVDEDLIEATIRRVQAQKAEVDAEPPATAATRHDAPDDDAIEATIRRVQAEKAAREASVAPAPLSLPRDHAPAITPVERGGDPESFEPVSEVSYSDDVIARLERGLREAAHALAVLTARVDALERGERVAGAATPTPLTLPRHDDEPSDDWDDEQPPAVAGFGTPPRPSIVPQNAAAASRTALAEQLPEPAVIDARPLPRPLPPLQVEPKRGLDLLPRTYRVTVEDKRRGVDLVPLHRALLSMDGVRDMSLLSYNNGVAIVALDMTADLDADDLGKFVARAMSRAARVEQHNEHTFVVKLAED